MTNLTKQEINSRIAELLGYYVEIEDGMVWILPHPDTSGTTPFYTGTCGGTRIMAQEADYTNNWNTLMPEIEKLALKIETFDRGTHVLVRLVIKDNSNSFTEKAGLQCSPMNNSPEN